MAGIDQKNGAIDNKYFTVMKNWTRQNTLQDALKGIRKEMESSAFKKLTQPQEGSAF